MANSETTGKNIERLKRKRTTLKGICTRLMNKTEELLNKEIDNIEQIEDVRDQLIIKENEILSVESEIEHSTEDLDELQSEIESRQDYRDRIFEIKARLNRSIKSFNSSKNKGETEALASSKEGENLNAVFNNSKFKPEQKLGVKLPKLTIEKFSGNPEAWQEFWGQFTTVIHENVHLSNIDKFTYLKGYVTGSALTALQGISVSDQNYATALDILKRRFGRKEIIVRHRLDALINMNPVRSASQIKELRLLYDTLEINIRSLETLGIDLRSYGNLLFPIVTKLIPNNILLEYNRNQADNDDWDITNLLKYLKTEVETREKTFLFGKRETGNSNVNSGYNRGAYSKLNEASIKRNKHAFNKSPISSISAFKVAVKSCVFCNDAANENNHESSLCSMSVNEKRTSLRKKGFCFLCLKRGSHIAKYCSAKFRCDICGGKHNHLICDRGADFGESRQSAVNTCALEETETKNENVDLLVSESKALVATSECSMDNSMNKNEILLQTCSAQISSGFKAKQCKILLDNASMRSFITKSLAKELKLPVIRKEKLLIYPFSCSDPTEKSYDVVEFTLFNTDDPSKCITVQTLIVDAISGTNLSFPSSGIRKILNRNNIHISSLLERNRDKPDVLLGAQYFWDINEGSKRKITRSLFAILTKFGWTLQGHANEVYPQNKNVSVMKLEIDDINIRAFWDLEAIGINPNTENLNLDKEFIQRVESNLTFKDGRYSTGLLWKLNKKELNSNFGVAKQRFENLRFKLKKDAWVNDKYKEIINDQLKCGIVEECAEDSTENSYFMPHRAVIRTDKSTTQVRIVFDASSKAANCLSLNDCLLVGPNLNPKLLDIILRFRIHKIAFCGDIEKAFLMIAIHEQDRNYLKFLWFPDNSNSDSYKILRMTRLPFGMSTSPFILAIVIKHHIKKYEADKNEAVKMLDSSMYVDDLFHGSNTVKEAFNLSFEAKKILSEASMNLRKLRTNSEELRKLWDAKGIVINEDSSEDPLKVLGLIWNAKDDTFKLDIEPLIESLDNVRCTKRSILRTVARIFDPVGIITPFTVRVKCLLQEVWEIGANWDDLLPENVTQQWKKWCSEMEHLGSLSFDRKYFHHPVDLNNGLVQLHIFSDASPKSYGAVAYFRCEDGEGNISTSFIMSKSRVAPLKRLTLPRLELMGALIAARIYKYLKSVFILSNIDVHFWTDSYITLFWIKGSARKWKPFVANRVVEIQSVTDPKCWNYCKGKMNPADYITRGEEVKSLKSNSLWWHGPIWLLKAEQLWPKSSPINMEDESQLIVERKSNPERIMQFSCQVDSIREPLLDLEKFSNVMKIFRITAWIKRFLQNLKSNTQRRSGTLVAEEIREAQNYWVKLIQEQNFKEELDCLRRGDSVPKKSNLLNFDIFIDTEGILRIGGRLQKSKFEFTQKYPILLPKKNRLSELLILQAHEKVFHFGINDTLVQVREQFWIVKGRQLVKNILKKCVICKRYNSRPGAQIMAPLPEERISQQPPFSVSGLDFAGPIFVKNSEVKHYILLCTCAVTRAVHLELVNGLSTETFLLAFRRFVARRGLCTTIYSDNAKTFHREDLELRIIWNIINHPDVKDFYASHSITWKFIVEKAAWWGGFYERMIRSVKTCLKKVVGKSSLSLPQLETVLAEIEAIVNSRALTFVYSDSKEQSPLTPSHFLVGLRLTSLPSVHIYTRNFAGSTETLVKRFNYRERLLQNFWSRWKKEYIFQLRSVTCTKTSGVFEFKEDDIVLIHEDKLPRNLWKLGRVIQLFTGRDGKVRSCMLKTSSGVLKRPIQLLFPLEVTNFQLDT